MNLLLESFWHALMDCFRPRVMLLSAAPLVLMAVLSATIGVLYWDASLNWVRATLEASSIVGAVSGWMQALGLGGITSVLAPVIVVVAVMPVVLVALLMTPALTKLVARQRFTGLECKEGGSLLLGLSWSLLSTLLALVATVVSIPLWFIPPLILVLPPLIWGWLTYRVMAFDALAEGAVTPFVGAGFIWASGALFAAAFVVLVPIGIWLYTWVFALSSLWFAHFCLRALQTLREEREPGVSPDGASVLPVTLDESEALPFAHDSSSR